MHTCEIIVRGYGNKPRDLCGKPATKSVIRHALASGEVVDYDIIQWLCDEHYEYAAANWKIPVEF